MARKLAANRPRRQVPQHRRCCVACNGYHRCRASSCRGDRQINHCHAPDRKGFPGVNLCAGSSHVAEDAGARYIAACAVTATIVVAIITIARTCCTATAIVWTVVALPPGTRIAKGHVPHSDRVIFACSDCLAAIKARKPGCIHRTRVSYQLVPQERLGCVGAHFPNAGL